MVTCIFFKQNTRKRGSETDFAKETSQPLISRWECKRWIFSVSEYTALLWIWQLLFARIYSDRNGKHGVNAVRLCLAVGVSCWAAACSWAGWVLQAQASPAALAGFQGCLPSAQGGGGHRYTLLLLEPFCSTLLACRATNGGEFWCATLRATELLLVWDKHFLPNSLKEITKAIFVCVCGFRYHWNLHVLNFL